MGPSVPGATLRNQPDVTRDNLWRPTKDPDVDCVLVTKEYRLF